MELKPDIVDRLNEWEARLREPFPFDENDSELARQWKERQQAKADMARDAAAEIKRLRALSSPHPEDGEAVRRQTIEECAKHLDDTAKQWDAAYGMGGTYPSAFRQAAGALRALSKQSEG